jgi:cobyrinic acid a,c-diamide synthase
MTEQDPLDPIDKELRDAERRGEVAEEARRLYREHRVLGVALEVTDEHLAEEKLNLAQAREEAKAGKTSEALQKVADSREEIDRIKNFKTEHRQKYKDNLTTARRHVRDNRGVYEDLAFNDAALESDQEIRFGGRSTKDHE